jgi:hypothetical protein
MVAKSRRAKIACSIDARVLARVERMRANTGESRSAVINRALEQLTAGELASEQEARYLQTYQDHPETAEAISDARALAQRVLSGLAWDDEP